MMTVLGCACSDDSENEAAQDLGGQESGALGGADQDELPQLALNSVPGDITFTATRADTTHIYSMEAGGSLRQRLTAESAAWSYHAVGPQRRYIAAVIQEGTLVDGTPDLDSNGTVWIIDVQTRRSFPISPEGCNAGIGGVGWMSEDRVAFSMSCGDDYPIAYRAPIENPERSLANLLAISAHTEPVVQVAPALNSSIYTYVLHSEVCNESDCVQVAEIWAADAEAQIGLADGDRPRSRCRITQSPDVNETDSQGGPLGDSAPRFHSNLGSITFSRATEEGGRDAFKVGVAISRLLDGTSLQCDEPGSLEQLSDGLYDDNYITTDTGTAQGNEYFPQLSTYGEETIEHLLFIGRGESRSTVYMVSPGVTQPIPLTEKSEKVIYARWIHQDSEFEGRR